MNQNNEFTVNSGMLAVLGALRGGITTSISPISFEPGRVVTAEEKNVLAAAGACDDGGQVVPGLKPALEVLGTATAFTRMVISGGPNAYEYIVYFTPDGRSASLISIGQEVQINAPSLAHIFLEMAAQNLGSTIYQNASLDVLLTPDEALVFCSLVDLQRKVILHSLADDREIEIPAVSASAISDGLNGREGKYQWLGTVMMELLSRTGEPADGQIQAALATLATKGLVQQAGISWKLSDTGAYLARRMLVFDTSLVLTAGYLGNSGTVSVGGFTCLQAGVHDLLFIDASGSSVALQSISSAGILDYTRQFLTDPSVHKKLDDTVPGGTSASPASAPVHRHCTQCGAEIGEGKKFCNKCGAKVP